MFCFVFFNSKFSEEMSIESEIKTWTTLPNMQKVPKGINE